MRAEFEEVEQVAREDLVALGDDIRALDLDVQMPDADAEGRQHYDQAVQRYTEAEQALDRARGPADLEPVTSALEEGRWAMEAAKAELAGGEAPERRPPCFFDPRHGPSVADVECPFCGAVMRAGKGSRRTIWVGMVSGGLLAAAAAYGAHIELGWSLAASAVVIAVVAALTGAGLTGYAWLRDDLHHRPPGM